VDGGNGGDPNTLYFAAGINAEADGLFGSLTPVAAGTHEGPAKAQAVTAPLDVVQPDLASRVGSSRANVPDVFTSLRDG
jgi:hypothetical protein